MANEYKCRECVAVEPRQLREQPAGSHKRASPQTFFSRKCLFCLLAGKSALMTRVFHCFLQYLNADVGTAERKHVKCR